MRILTILVALLCLFSPACTKKTIKTAASPMSGPIHIKVTDDNGDNLPGATIVIVSNAQPTPRYLVSGQDGVALEALPVGETRISVAFSGFKNLNKSIVLKPDVPEDLTLEIEVQGSIADELIVTASLPVIDSSVRGMPARVGAYSPPAMSRPYLPAKWAPEIARAENTFIDTAQTPVSTFSVDVDTAAYSNLRAHLLDEQRPNPEDLRIEEMINYFRYDQAEPTGPDPIGITTELGPSPWRRDALLARIGLRAKSIPSAKRPPANLIFLIDTSGSMNDADKLGLIVDSLSLLVQNLTERDRVAIVTYAGSAGVVLAPTRGDDFSTIVEALNDMEPEGGTDGSAGIELAYQLAKSQFITGGINRVILATDGDFNLGIANPSDLTHFIAEKAATGVFLTVLGVGGDANDHLAETLADRGNGNYAYLDDLEEGRKVLVDQIDGTLVTVAKDVKLQVSFDPKQVAAYRLIGYENRLLAEEDFKDDKVDAGEMGAGHQVVALYEIEPTPNPTKETWFKVDVRYKQPDADRSQLFTHSHGTRQADLWQTSDDFRFAAAVAAFGMWLTESPFLGDFNLEDIHSLGASAQGLDSYGHRSEFLDLVDLAHLLLPLPQDDLDEDDEEDADME